MRRSGGHEQPNRKFHLPVRCRPHSCRQYRSRSQPSMVPALRYDTSAHERARRGRRTRRVVVFLSRHRVGSASRETTYSPVSRTVYAGAVSASLSSARSKKKAAVLQPQTLQQLAVRRRRTSPRGVAIVLRRTAESWEIEALADGRRRAPKPRLRHVDDPISSTALDGGGERGGVANRDAHGCKTSSAWTFALSQRATVAVLNSCHVYSRTMVTADRTFTETSCQKSNRNGRNQVLADETRYGSVIRDNVPGLRQPAVEL